MLDDQKEKYLQIKYNLDTKKVIYAYSITIKSVLQCNS